MPGCVHPHEVVGKGVFSTLHVVPECLHIRAVEKLRDHRIIRPLAGGPGRNITLQAAGVGTEPHQRITKVRVWVGWRAGEASEYRTEIHGPVFERSRSHTATSTAVRDADESRILLWDAIEGLVLTASDTVAAHRCGRTVQ